MHDERLIFTSVSDGTRNTPHNPLLLYVDCHRSRQDVSIRDLQGNFTSPAFSCQSIVALRSLEGAQNDLCSCLHDPVIRSSTKHSTPDFVLIADGLSTATDLESVRPRAIFLMSFLLK